MPSYIFDIRRAPYLHLFKHVETIPAAAGHLSTGNISPKIFARSSVQLSVFDRSSIFGEFPS